MPSLGQGCPRWSLCQMAGPVTVTDLRPEAVDTAPSTFRDSEPGAPPFRMRVPAVLCLNSVSAPPRWHDLAGRSHDGRTRMETAPTMLCLDRQRRIRKGGSRPGRWARDRSGFCRADPSIACARLKCRIRLLDVASCCWAGVCWEPRTPWRTIDVRPLSYCPKTNSLSGQETWSL